jgi:4-amino-4-deoxy-L-arabinose transferase-like glycosyltransferase
MKADQNKISRFFLPVIIILFILSRIGNLNLPFYWDEAWSYAKAVFDMAENGLAILPGDANPGLTRGHPLLFYFLSALWIKIFGSKLVVVHLFSLLFSCTLLLALYMVARDIFNETTALVATFLFALNTIFLAQSTQLLPEIMLALFTLLTFYAYVRKKWIPFAFFSVLLVMTKETGMVLAGTLFLDKLLLEKLVFKDQKRSWPILTKELAILCIPFIAFASFMVLQKVHMGWFLFPEHMGMTISDPRVILERINSLFFRLLFQHGMIVFFLLAIIGLIFLIYKKAIAGFPARALFFSGVFIIFYIVFSAVNFFTTRYLLSLLPFLIMCGSWLIIQIFHNRLQTQRLVVVSLSLLFGYYAFIGYRSEADVSLQYKNTVLLQKQAVNFAEKMQWQEKSVYTSFLMLFYLSDPNLGYLGDKTKPFTHLNNDPKSVYDIYLFCSNENDPYCQIIKNDSCCFLQKRFENKGAWVEFYVRNELQNQRITNQTASYDK